MIIQNNKYCTVYKLVEDTLYQSCHLSFHHLFNEAKAELLFAQSIMTTVKRTHKNTIDINTK